jgi:hypothetical protein
VRSFGGVGTACVAMSLGVLTTAVTTESGFQPGWAFYAGIGLPALGAALVHGRRRLRTKIASALRSTPWPSNGLVAVTALSLFLTVAGTTLALRSAWLSDFGAVAEILARVGRGR